MSGQDQNRRPTLSVVMPAYNAEKYITRAIDSILNQTHSDLELIIGDDSSTDSTWAIITEYAMRDPRVKAFRNEVNSGATTTINRAVAMATAPVIAGMDSDDIALPYRMERQLTMLDRHPEIALVGCYVSHINEHDDVLSLSKIGPSSIADFERMRQHGEPILALGGTTMYRREDFDAIGGFESSLRVAGDLEFCDRMASRGAVVAVPEALQLYRVHGSSNVMNRFREGRRTHRFLQARRASRLAGRPLPTLAEYIASEREQSLWSRLQMWRDDSRQYYYRKGGLAYAAGNPYRTALYLGVAGMIGPGYVLGRLWHQRLSPEARRTRERLEQERSDFATDRAGSA